MKIGGNAKGSEIGLTVLAAFAWIVATLAAKGAGEVICFEAESADTVTAVVKIVTAELSTESAAVKEASGGKCLEIPEGAGKPPEAGGEAIYKFEAQNDGKFVLWIRSWWTDGCGNSLTLILDNGRPFIFGEDGTFKAWHWVRGMKAELKAGAHELKIQNREDGIKIDQILFASDTRYVPTGIEDVTAKVPGTH